MLMDKNPPGELIAGKTPSDKCKVVLMQPDEVGATMKTSVNFETTLKPSVENSVMQSDILAHSTKPSMSTRVPLSQLIRTRLP